MMKLTAQNNAQMLLLRNLIIVVLIVLSIPVGISSFCLSTISLAANDCEIIAADECCGSTEPEQIECEYCYTVQTMYVSELFRPSVNAGLSFTVYSNEDRLYGPLLAAPPFNSPQYIDLELQQEALKQQVLATVFLI